MLVHIQNPRGEFENESTLGDGETKGNRYKDN
jgi:hypothetical protein